MNSLKRQESVLSIAEDGEGLTGVVCIDILNHETVHNKDATVTLQRNREFYSISEADDSMLQLDQQDVESIYARMSKSSHER